MEASRGSPPGVDQPEDYTLKAEPRAQIYSGLLDAVGRRSDRVGFVLRGRLPVQDPAQALVANLSQWLVEKHQVWEWPGTLTGDPAGVTLCLFECVPSAIDQIREVTDRLFGWIWPLPEDLHFYSGDRLLLGSVAHEREGWLMLTPTEFRDITNEVVGLKHLLERT